MNRNEIEKPPIVIKEIGVNLSANFPEGRSRIIITSVDIVIMNPES